jgi:hypothetical protein
VLTQLFVDAKEIDLSHFDSLTVRRHLNWNSRNKSEKLLLLTTTHTNDPIRVVFGGSEGPLEELHRVVKSEVTSIIFNVVIRQKSVKLLCLHLVVHVYARPFVSCGKAEGFCLDIANSLLLNRSVKLLNGIVNAHHGLGRPKFVVVEKRDHTIKSLLSPAVSSQARFALLQSFGDFLDGTFWSFEEAQKKALLEWIERNFSELLLNIGN